jgi:hypothetical protein
MKTIKLSDLLLTATLVALPTAVWAQPGVMPFPASPAEEQQAGEVIREGWREGRPGRGPRADGGPRTDRGPRTEPRGAPRGERLDGRRDGEELGVGAGRGAGHRADAPRGRRMHGRPEGGPQRGPSAERGPFRGDDKRAFDGRGLGRGFGNESEPGKDGPRRHGLGRGAGDGLYRRHPEQRRAFGESNQPHRGEARNESTFGEGRNRVGRNPHGRFGPNRGDLNTPGPNRAAAPTVAPTTVRGTVTVVAADNSVGLRSEDGRSIWVRLPERVTRRPQVGDVLEVVGQWKDNFFVSESLRLR